MTELFDIINARELVEAVRDGYIREQSHPEFPNLRILNYTEKAQFERHWNHTIRTCRGLIFDADTTEVLARPFPKIHNWDEPEAPAIDWDAPLYSWSNKWDGSLGIMYIRPDGQPALATRGSFASEQAIRGTEMVAPGLDSYYAQWLDDGYTPLFEIIYPENRIVLDYGGESFLAPLGVIHIPTGQYIPDPLAIGEQRTFREVVTDLSRDNAEGWVAWPNSVKAVKIKQADYVELHRVMTGLNKKEVWRALSQNRLTDLINSVPDELHEDIQNWANEIESDYLSVSSIAINAHRNVPQDTRKEQALWITKHVAPPYRGLVFSLLDERSIRDAIYKMIEPKGGV